MNHFKNREIVKEQILPQVLEYEKVAVEVLNTVKNFDDCSSFGHKELQKNKNAIVEHQKNLNLLRTPLKFPVLL